MKPKQKSSQTEMVKILLIVLGIGIGLFIICKMTKKEGLKDGPTDSCTLIMPCYGTVDSTSPQAIPAGTSIKCKTNYSDYFDNNHNFRTDTDVPDSSSFVKKQLDGLFYCPKQYHIKDVPLDQLKDTCKLIQSETNCAPGWRNGPGAGDICTVQTSSCQIANGDPNDRTKCKSDAYVPPDCGQCANGHPMMWNGTTGNVDCTSATVNPPTK